MRDFYSEDSEEDDEVAGLYQQFSYFIESDQNERVVSVGTELLSKNPYDEFVHNLVGHAYTALGNYDAAEKHLKTAIANDPEYGYAYANLANLELQRGRAGKADEYVRVAIRLDPTDVYSWNIFALLCIHFDDYKQAQVCVNKIRELDPESGIADALEVKARTYIEGKTQYTTEEKLAANENLLGRDPEAGHVHYQLGYIHIEETEFHFRKALEADPTDKDYQKGLILCWRKRDVLLKLIWVPYLPIAWVLKLCEWCHKKKWPYIFMIFLFKYILMMSIIVALIFFTIFWPVAKLYEYMTLAEIHRKMGMLKLYSGMMERVHTWKFKNRIAIFIGMVSIFWGSLIIAIPIFFAKPAVNKAFLILITGLFFLFICASWTYLLISGHRQRRRNRKNKKFNLKA